MRTPIIVKLSSTIISSLIAFTACSKAADKSIEVIVLKQTREGSTYCKLLLEITNKTGLNLTSIDLNYVVRDSAGNILAKAKRAGLRAAPNAVANDNMLIDNCKDAAQLEFTDLDTNFSEINGDSGLRNAQVKTMLSTMSVVAGSRIQSLQVKGPNGSIAFTQAISAGNLLEQTISPVTGTRALWEKFKDEGALNSISDFYGLDVSNVRIQFNSDKVSWALINVSKAIAPKQIRAALGNVCKGKDEDWKIQNGSLTTGQILSGGISCSYLTNDTAKAYEIVLERK